VQRRAERATVAGRKAFSLNRRIIRGRTVAFTVKLRRAATTRLVSNGGTLKVSARTIGSTLKAATDWVRIAARRR
jgi:hypothetical protein